MSFKILLVANQFFVLLVSGAKPNQKQTLWYCELWSCFWFGCNTCRSTAVFHTILSNLVGLVQLVAAPQLLHWNDTSLYFKDSYMMHFSLIRNGKSNRKFVAFRLVWIIFHYHVGVFSELRTFTGQLLLTTSLATRTVERETQIT